MTTERRRSGSDEEGGAVTKEHKMGVISCSSYVIGGNICTVELIILLLVFWLWDIRYISTFSIFKIW